MNAKAAVQSRKVCLLFINCLRCFLVVCDISRTLWFGFFLQLHFQSGSTHYSAYKTIEHQIAIQYLQMKWPLLDVQAGTLQSRQALKDARSPSPAHIVVSDLAKAVASFIGRRWRNILLLITGLAYLFFSLKNRYFWIILGYGLYLKGICFLLLDLSDGYPPGNFLDLLTTPSCLCWVGLVLWSP